MGVQGLHTKTRQKYSNEKMSTKTLLPPPSGLQERQRTLLLIIATALVKPKVGVSQEI